MLKVAVVVWTDVTHPFCSVESEHTNPRVRTVALTLTRSGCRDLPNAGGLERASEGKPSRTPSVARGRWGTAGWRELRRPARDNCQWGGACECSEDEGSFWREEYAKVAGWKTMATATGG